MSEEEDVYIVEKIVGMQNTPAGTLYHVKWKDYPSDENTWEPPEHLVGCQELLNDFLMENERKEKEKREKKQQKMEKQLAEKDAKRIAKEKEARTRLKKMRDSCNMMSGKPIVAKSMQKPVNEPLVPGEEILGFVQDGTQLLVKCADGRLKVITREQAKKYYLKAYLKYLHTQMLLYIS